MVKICAATAFFLLNVCASAAVIQVGPSAFAPTDTRLDFDELTSPTQIGSLYAALGVQFQNATAEIGDFALTPFNVLLASDLGTAVIITFPGGVYRFGIQIDSDGYDPDRQPQMRAYDSLNNLLGTLIFGQGPQFQGFQATSGLIARIELGSCKPVDVTTCQPLDYSDSYDNMVFALRPDDAPTHLPEPSTIAGGIFGALVLVTAHLKRRR